VPGIIGDVLKGCIFAGRAVIPAVM